uniref:Kelch-like protein 18 n=2 Tax=Schistocephalus solidus TaxID=70667 RepID=A0A0X3Q4J2_SCHSO
MSLRNVQVFEDDAPLIRSCPQLNRFRLLQEHKDIMITLKDGSFLYAHKVILAARIQSLRNTLNELSLSTPTPAIIQWKDASQTCAAMILQYIYTGQLEVDVQNATGVVTLARHLQLPHIEKWVVSFLLDRLNEENLTMAWNFCQSLNIEPLATACIELIKETFQSFALSELFIHLPAANLLSLLRDDELHVAEEEDIVEAISRWISVKNNVNRRSDLLPAIMKEIDWRRTKPQCRKRLFESGDVAENEECIKRFYLLEQWIDRPLTRGVSECPFRKSNRGRKRLFLIGQSRGGTEWLLQPYDANSETDVPLFHVKERFSGAYASVDGTLFAMGGFVRSMWSPGVHEINLLNHRQRPRASLTVPRSRHAAAVVRVNDGFKVNKWIAVCGGWNAEENQLCSCEIFNPRQNEWRHLPDMSCRRESPAAVAVPGSRLFVLGGYNGRSYLSSVVFCSLSSKWEVTGVASGGEFWKTVAPMSAERACLAATYFRGCIVAAGGWNGEEYLSLVEVFSLPDAYRTPEGQWTRIACMQQSRRSFHLLACASAIFALGNAKDPEDTVEELAPSNDPSVARGGGLASWRWSLKRQPTAIKSIKGAVYALF